MSDATRSVDAAGVAATTGGLGRTVAAAGSTFTGTYAVPITKAGLIALVCDRDGGKTDAQSEALGFNLTVTALSVCGSKVLDAGGGAVETCDDANAVSGDGCDRQCHIEPGWSCSYPADGDRSVCVKACSNGAIECPDPKGPFCEQCDDGNLYPGDGCDADCQLEADFNCTTLTAGEKAEHQAPVINNVDDLGVQGGGAPGMVVPRATAVTGWGHMDAHG
jgi:cysteine-rich repeat protein